MTTQSLYQRRTMPRFPIVHLPDDCLRCVFAHVPDGDLYCLARACSRLYTVLDTHSFRTAAWCSSRRLEFALADGYVCTTDLGTVAARLNALEILRWLMNTTRRVSLSKSILNAASEHGSFETVQWLTLRNCPHDHGATCLAAEHGHLSVVKWLRYMYSCEYDDMIILCAAMRGQMHVLEFGVYHGLFMCEECMHVAACDDHLSAFVFLYENGCPHYSIEYIRENAERTQSWDVLDWLDWEGDDFE